jgi:hypothetical protein
MTDKIAVASRFIHAKYDDYGVRQAPALGFALHMAEGWNVAQYLAFGNVARGVSVHFTVERDGEIIQQMELGRISGSINPSTIRRDDDPNGNFGWSHNKAVLGEWATNPNHAVISVEVAGFSRYGPNEAQVQAIVKLFNFLRGKYPSIKPLGHRDFQNVKPCPGQKFYHKVYPRLGGHGKDFDPHGGGTTDQMLVTGDNVKRTSSHYIELPEGVSIFKSPEGEILRKTTNGVKKYDFFGNAGDWWAIRTNASGSEFSDGQAREVIAYVKKATRFKPEAYPSEPEPSPSEREKLLTSALLEVGEDAAKVTAVSSRITETVDTALREP